MWNWKVTDSFAFFRLFQISCLTAWCANPEFADNLVICTAFPLTHTSTKPLREVFSPILESCQSCFLFFLLFFTPKLCVDCCKTLSSTFTFMPSTWTLRIFFSGKLMLDSLLRRVSPFHVQTSAVCSLLQHSLMVLQYTNASRENYKLFCCKCGLCLQFCPEDTHFYLNISLILSI